MSSTKQFPRSATSSNLASAGSVPPHLHRLPRSASLVSMDGEARSSRRTMSIEDDRTSRLGSPGLSSSSRLRSSTPLSPRKPRGQFVWTPTEGFTSSQRPATAERTTSFSSSTNGYLPAGNAAERILQVLEDVETPLDEARKGQVGGVPKLGELSRSFSLGRIHIPAATKEKEKEEKRREVMISPYGRTSRQARDRGLATSGSGLRRLVSTEGGSGGGEGGLRRSTTEGNLSSLGRVREDSEEPRKRGRGRAEEGNGSREEKKGSKRRGESRDSNMMDDDRERESQVFYASLACSC
jgi:hypothetical protein